MARLVTRESHDVDDQAKALAGWEQDYEQLGCGRFRGSVWQLVMADGVLLRETTNRQLRERIVPPRDHLVFAVPLAVQPGSVFAGRPLGRDHLMLLGAHTEHDLISAGELDLIGLAVDRRLAQAHLAPEGLDWLDRKCVERNVALPPQTAMAIRHLLLAACSDAAQGRGWTAEGDPEGAREHAGQGAQAAAQEADAAADQALLSSTLSHAVVLAMSAERAGGDAAGSLPRRAESRLKVVRRAVDYMRASLHEDIGVPEICAAACASRRTLQYCFEEFLHTTPQAYLRALRLNEARRQLKGASRPTIADLAATLGFASASHFTQHYRLMFDELPSQTRKLRG